MKKLVLAVVLSAIGGAASADDSQRLFGTWLYSNDPDAMTDKARISATQADPTKRSGLVFSCHQGQPGISVTFARLGYIADGERTFLYRIDDAPAVKVTAFYTQNAVFFPWDWKVTAAMLKAARAGKVIKMRAYAYDGEQIDASFDITHAAEVLKKLQEDCGPS
jgi:hypothetical protein